MNTVFKKQTQQVLQIPLYRNAIKCSSWWKVIGSVGIGIVCGALYWILPIKESLSAVLAMLLVTGSMLIIFYQRFLFLTSSGTLILAYGELYFLNREQIVWAKNLSQLSIRQEYDENLNCPVLTIADEYQILLCVYLTTFKVIRKKTISKLNDYHLISKSDWNVLTNSFQTNNTALE